MSGPEVKLEFGDPGVGSWHLAGASASMDSGKKSLTIGGQDALEATDSDGDVVCWVKLGGDDDTAMSVTTPDAAGCAAVATAALNNLAKSH